MTYIQSPLCFFCCEIGIRKSIVDAERNNGDASPSYPKVIHKLLFHFLCMNENVVGKLVLDAQRKTIEARIVTIPFACIYIVRSENDFLA